MTEPVRILLAAQTPPMLVRCLEAAAAVPPLALAAPRLATAGALLRAAAVEEVDAAVIAATLPGLDPALIASLRELGLGIVVATWGAATAPADGVGVPTVAGETLRQAPADLAAAVQAALAAEAAAGPITPAPDAAAPGATAVAASRALSSDTMTAGGAPETAPRGTAPSGPPRSWRARRAASLGLTGDAHLAAAHPAAPATGPVAASPAVTGDGRRPEPVTGRTADAVPAVLPVAQLPPSVEPDALSAAAEPAPIGPPMPDDQGSPPRRAPAAAPTAHRRTTGAEGLANGHLVALLSGPGGAGGTTIAHGLAAALGPDPVLLLDLDPAGDSAGPALDLPAVGAGAVGLAAASAARDAGAWRAALDREAKPVLPHLRALLGPARVADGAYLGPALVADLLGAARMAATWTVVDLGRWAGPYAPWQAAVIAAADLVLIASRSDRAALARLQAWLDEGLLAGRRAGVHLLVTRAPAGRGDDAGRIAAGLGLPVAAALPDDPAAATWLAEHRAPIALAAGPLAAAVRALALAIRAGAAPPTPAAAASPAPAPVRRGLTWLPGPLAALWSRRPRRLTTPAPGAAPAREEARA